MFFRQKLSQVLQNSVKKLHTYRPLDFEWDADVLLVWGDGVLSEGALPVELEVDLGLVVGQADPELGGAHLWALPGLGGVAAAAVAVGGPLVVVPEALQVDLEDPGLLPEVWGGHGWSRKGCHQS